ncbi:MAG TPA: molybdenum cofactor cytidylyltransferase [Bryobacteraceae bacterium]|nr:molybdenum cofactor cytidylyltransferase [Bryobacteraceae bacterium]
MFYGPEERSGVSAIVLAAGTSTRMGTLKQLLTLRGKPLLQHVLDNLRGAQVDEIVLVLGSAADQIQRQISFDSVQVAINEAYRDGMGSSLRTGIGCVASKTEAVIIVLGDQPFVRTETINRLISEYREKKPQIVIPVYGGSRGNPVLIDRSIFPELMELSGDTGCRAVFEKYPNSILRVAVDDPGVLFDLDTPDDFEKAGS